jgi:tetratricopeptide (TPR) repeat protein
MTYESQGNYDQALDCLKQASQALSTSGLQSPAEMSQILNDSGWIHFRRGNLDEAEKTLLQAHELAEQASRLDIVSSTYNRLGGVYYLKDQVEKAISYVSKSIAIRQEIGDILGVARSYNNLGNLGWKMGAWDDALDNFKRSADLQVNLGDVEAIIIINDNLGRLQIDRGFPDEARKYLKDAINRAEQIGHNFLIALLNHHISVLEAHLEDWPSALQYELRSESLFMNLGEKVNLVDVNVNLGLIYLGLKELGKAAKCGQQAITLLGEVAEDTEIESRGCALRLLGDVALAAGNLDESAKMYTQSAQILDLIGNRIERGRLWVSQANLAQARSARAEAESCLAQAGELFKQLGARLELRRVQSLQAKLAA